MRLYIFISPCLFFFLDLIQQTLWMRPIHRHYLMSHYIWELCLPLIQYEIPSQSLIMSKSYFKDYASQCLTWLVSSLGSMIFHNIDASQHNVTTYMHKFMSLLLHILWLAILSQYVTYEIPCTFAIQFEPWLFIMMYAIEYISNVYDNINHLLTHLANTMLTFNHVINEFNT